MHMTIEQADRRASHYTATAAALAQDVSDLDAELAATIEAINALPISDATKAALIAQNTEIIRQAKNA